MRQMWQDVYLLLVVAFTRYPIFRHDLKCYDTENNQQRIRLTFNRYSQKAIGHNEFISMVCSGTQKRLDRSM